MDSETQAALDDLLPPSEQTGNEVNDLFEAARRALERRRTNSVNGGLVLKALNIGHGFTYAEIDKRTGIAPATAQRWSNPPK